MPPKRGKKRSRKGAAIQRYGAEAVRKYYTAPSRRLVRAPGETGFVDLASADYALNNTGSIVLIATIPQGASTNERVGKKIMLKSLQCRGNVHNDGTATVNEVAYLIVYDNRPTGTLPAITDVLNTANSRSFNNDVNSGRFKILKRVDTVLAGSAASGSTQGTQKNADFFLKINRQCVFAAAGTGAIGDISLGALYLITVGDVAAGTADATATMGFRTRYIDI